MYPYSNFISEKWSNFFPKTWKKSFFQNSKKKVQKKKSFSKNQKKVFFKTHIFQFSKNLNPLTLHTNDPTKVIPIHQGNIILSPTYYLFLRFYVLLLDSWQEISLFRSSGFGRFRYLVQTFVAEITDIWEMSNKW